MSDVNYAGAPPHTNGAREQDEFAAAWYEATQKVWYLQCIFPTCLVIMALARGTSPDFTTLVLPVPMYFHNLVHMWVSRYARADRVWYYRGAECALFLASIPLIAAIWSNYLHSAHYIGPHALVIFHVNALMFCIVLQSLYVGNAWRVGSVVALSLMGPVPNPIFGDFISHEDEVLSFAVLASVSAVIMHALEVATHNAFEQRRARIDSERNFVALTAHEVRNPLSAVAGYLQLVELRRDADRPEEADAMVRAAMNSTRIAVSILENLNDLCRIEAGLLQPVVAPMNLEQVLRDAAIIVQPRLSSRVALRLRYTPTCAENGDAFGVLSDAKILTQVLANLGINAAKFTRLGFVEIECVVRKRVPASASSPPGSRGVEVRGWSLSVAFTVRDSGSGITAELMKTIFDRYSTQGGLGLGLYLSKQQVERLNASAPLAAYAAPQV